MKKTKKYFFKLISWKFFPYFLFFIFALISVYPSLVGNYHYGDDIHFHLSAIKTYADGLPFSFCYKVFENITYNFGFGMGLFYPPLPHIVGAIIYKVVSIFGIGINCADTIFHIVTLFFIGSSMFILAKKVFDDDKKACLAGLFYMTYNYVYVDVIMRDAMNESFIFIFIPIIFLGLWYLLKENNTKMFYIFFIFGYICLMYSHLVLAVYFTLFLFVFLLVFVRNIFIKEKFIPLLISTFIILIFTSTFYVPMIEHKLFGNYVVFLNRTMSLEDVWYMPLEGFYKYYSYLSNADYGGLIYANFNAVVLVFLFLGFYKIITKKVPDNRWNFMIGIILFGVVALIFETIPMIWPHMPSILLSIQFVWRLSTFVGFAVCFVAVEGIDSILNMFKKKYIYAVLIFIVLLLGNFTLQNVNRTVINDISAIFSGNYSYYDITREHFPVKAYKNMEYLKKRNHDIKIVKGNADVEMISNDVPSMKFKLSHLNSKTIVQLPRLYYLGYKITNSKGETIKYHEDKYGFITLTVSENDVYEVKYEGTIGYKIATILKILMLLCVFCVVCKRYTKKHEIFNKIKIVGKFKICNLKKH